MPLANDKMRYLIYSVTFFISVLSLVNIAFAEEQVPSVVEQGREYTNPHWGEDLCGECHEGVPEKGKKQTFKYGGDINMMCNSCHEVISLGSLIHATGMVPSEAILKRMPENFKKALYRGDKEGRVTCLVCHEIIYQCLKEEFKRKADNPLFFRGGPYSSRAAMCYKCHDPKQYQRLNPHNQIDDEGRLVAETCVYCHSVTPDRKKVKGIKDVTFRAAEDLINLCTGCHPISMHPPWQSFKGISSEVTRHFVKPPVDILNRLQQSEDIYNIILPLDPNTGKVFCCTCHNPHERGVHKNKADAGADDPKRLRSGHEVICTMCHQF